MRIFDSGIKRQLDFIRARLTRAEIELQDKEPPAIVLEETRARLVKIQTECNAILSALSIKA